MEFSGVALHTGEETSVRVLPGEPDTGYRFRMTGIEDCPEVEASVHNIKDTLLATSLGVNGASIKTVGNPPHLDESTNAVARAK